MRKPYYKSTHKAYYCQHDGKQVRLGATLAEAAERWKLLVRPLTDSPVSKAVGVFLDGLRVKASTRTFYASHLKLLPNVRVSDLRPLHLTGVMKGGQNYRRNIGRCAKRCFKWLAEQGYIPTNPFKGFKLPAAKSRDCAVEVDLSASPPDLHDILTFLVETGCRPKEARTMCARHLVDGRVEFPAEESKGGIPRTIHLTEVARALCMDRLRMDGPLFRCQGQPWTATKLARYCHRIGIQAYSIRHAFATRAIIRGVDLISIARLLGHSNLKMLNEVYSHIHENDQHMQDSLRKIG